MEEISKEQEDLDNEHINLCLHNELSSIMNDDIRFKTIKVLLNVNGEFWKMPASTTGKYHPQYALDEGGLLRHTKAAVMIANSLLDLECITIKLENSFPTIPYIKDYIRAALILHDCCKTGIQMETKYTKHEHPLLIAQLIKDVLGDCEFTIVVSDLVSTHMGQWTNCKWSNITLPAPTTFEQQFVHICDYLASRKFLEVNFDANDNQN